LYVWGVPKDKRKGPNRLDLCGSPASPASAQGRSAYVPLVVLMVVKRLNPREVEAYLAENVVARVFIGRQDSPILQIRDHFNIARVYPWARTV
jgi:hypothetical protein